jgi:hypothetical protein
METDTEPYMPIYQASRSFPAKQLPEVTQLAGWDVPVDVPEAIFILKSFETGSISIR